MFLVICHTSGGVLGVRESALKNVDGSIRVFDTREAAGTLVARLAPQERAAVVLKDVFDLSIEDIATALSTTPNAVKAVVQFTAVPLPNADPVAQGEGLINLHRAREAKISTIGAAVQTWPRSSGTGSLQLARGSVLTEDEGVVLQGEQTIFGDAWDGGTWASSSFEGTSWTDGAWNGRTWSGRTWSGESWSGRTWSGRTWSGRTWSGNGWSAGEWGGSDAPSALSSGAWASTLWGD